MQINVVVGFVWNYSLWALDKQLCKNHHLSMDALKAEIAAKRKAIQDDPIVASRPTKYMRRGDIELLKQEQEEAARLQATAPSLTPIVSKVLKRSYSIFSYVS